MSELRREIIDYFLKNGMIKTLEKYDKELPHIEFFEKMVKRHLDEKNEMIRIGRIWKTDIDHIEIVVKKMNSFLEGKFNKVVKNKDRNPKGHDELINIISSLEDDEKDFLLFTALYHDIAKSIIRPRHGPEGADIIKDSGYVERKRFYKLGFIRSKFFLMADLIRFHDYLAMVGTGETSHLIFAEVLSPISNISLSNKNYVDKFIDYLLILNLADVAGSIEEKISCEHFCTLLYDFKVIKGAHENISKIVYENVFKEDPNGSIIDIHKKTIAFRDPHDILSELQKVTIKLTNERIRRLVRTGFNSVKKKVDSGYLKWIKEHHKEGLEKNQLKPFEKWFERDYEKRVVDIEPIVASLRGINVKPDFYYKFSLICKLDYFLGLIRDLFEKIINVEVEKLDCVPGPRCRIKSPHDLRYDLAMSIVILIDTLMNHFGDFTSNETKIGLGFDRFMQISPLQKDKLMERLTGDVGDFKEAEALTKIRNSVVLWVISH